MKKIIKIVCALGLGAATMMLAGGSDSRAQVPLSAYTDANGYIDVQ